MSETDQHKVLWYYRRYVEDYYSEYQFGHFILAAYASVPALLTPDLLYKIWQNFHGYRWSNTPVSIHRIAVADLLLSPMCREVGFELYEMHHDIKQAFWEWLNIESAKDLWKKRGLQSPITLANFVSEYHARPNPGEQRWGEGYGQVQDYAVHFSKGEYDRLQYLLSSRLSEAIKNKRETETLRILDIWAKNGQQLEKLSPAEESTTNSLLFQQNARSADALKALMQQDVQGFLTKFGKDAGLLNSLEAGGIKIEVPGEVIATVEAAESQTIHVLIVGVDKYLGNISPLQGCVSDAEHVTAFLNQQRSTDKPIIVQKLLDDKATVSAFIAALQETFKSAKNGDICLFFFAGHTEFDQITDGGGRKFILHDSRGGETPNEPSQAILEEMLYPVLAEKSVQCIWIIDSHEANTEAKKQRLYEMPLRRNAAELKGSLVILNAASSGQMSYENTDKNGKKSGAFTTHLLDMLADQGTTLSYSNLLEKVKLRILQHEKNNPQTPFLEAFPASAANFMFLTDRLDTQKKYRLVFNTKANEWHLQAGTKQGITPSLSFMQTYLQLEDGRKIAIKEVFLEHATLLEFSESDQSKSFEATLIQTALPKVKIAFDPNLDKEMQERFLNAVKEYNLYFIELTENLSEAKYFIRNQAQKYYLNRHQSTGIKNDPFEQDRSIYIPVAQPFEFIKQLEYIAQWTGVLEYNNTVSSLKREDLSLGFEVIEGQETSPTNLDQLTATKKVEDSSVIDLHYIKSGESWLQPALRCNIKSNHPSEIYVQVLLLSGSYGISDLGNYRLDPSQILPLQWQEGNRQHNAIPFSMSDYAFELKQTEDYDYLKFFIFKQETNVSALVQEELKLEVTRNISVLDPKSSFDTAGGEWTSITVPIRIIRKAEEPIANPEPLDYTPNILLIDTLFNTLKGVNPEIQKLSESESRGEKVTPAKKRLAILNALPAPIAEGLRKLFVPVEEENAGYDKPTSARLQQIRLVYRHTIRYLTCIAVAEAQEHLGKDGNTATMELKDLINTFINQTKKEFDQSNVSKYLCYLIGALEENKVQFFVPELTALRKTILGDKTMENALSTLDEMPDPYSLTAAIVFFCKTAEEALGTLFSSLGFIAKYSLVSIHDVKVDNTRKVMNFKHDSIILKDMLGGFEKTNLTLPHALPSQSVLIVEEGGNWEHLNLSPFIIDESAFGNKLEINKLYYFERYAANEDAYLFQYINKPDDPNLIVTLNQIPLVFERFNVFRALVEDGSKVEQNTGEPDPKSKETPTEEPPKSVYATLFDTIEQLISDNETQSAIDAIREADKELKTGLNLDVIQVSANFKQNEKMHHEGRINNDEYFRQSAQVRQALLHIVESLKKSKNLGDVHPGNLDKIIGSKDKLLKINWLEKALKASKSVCRVVGDNIIGTGFISQDGYLFTVNHLISNPEMASKAQVEFNFEATAEGNIKPKVTYLLDSKDFISSPADQLDFTRIKIIDNPSQPLAQWGFVSFETNAIPKVNESVTIIQHPMGKDKQIALDANEVVGQLEQYLYYRTDTEPGSSGAPVFNADWKVVALHHAAGKFVVNARGDKLDVRQGILFKDILADISQKQREIPIQEQAATAYEPIVQQQTNIGSEEMPLNAPQPPKENTTPKFVVLYDSTDEDKFRILNRHLSALKLTKKIVIYGVYEAIAGEDILIRTKEEMVAADHILILLSANIFNGDAQWFSIALEALEQGKKVTPVYLNKIDVEGTGIEKLPSLPTEQPTIADFSNADAAYADVVNGIKRLIAGNTPA